MTQPAASLSIGWTLRVRAQARTPLAAPKPGEPPPDRHRQPSAEGPPTWRYVVGSFEDGAKPRSWATLAQAARVSNTPPPSMKD